MYDQHPPLCVPAPLMPKARAFAAFSASERLAIAEAAVLLLAARGLVAFVPLSRWRGVFALATEGCTAAPDPNARVTAVAVGRAVRRAERNLPGSWLCLPQALAARWMLARRGVASRLHLGTRRLPGGTLDHHAWLKVGQVWVTGHCNERDYAVFRPAG